MSEARPGPMSESPNAFNCKGGSYTKMMLALSKSHTAAEAIMSAKITRLELPPEAAIQEGLAGLDTIGKKFNEIGTTSIQENKATFANEAQKRTAEAAIIAAESQEQLRKVGNIYESFTKTIIPGLQVKPPSPETITAYTNLQNNVNSAEKALQQLLKQQQDLGPRIESTIKMGLSLLPESHRNTVSRQLQPK